MLYKLYKNYAFFDPDKSSNELFKILSQVFDQMDTMAGLLDTDGRVVFANHAALRSVGATQQQVHGVEFSASPWRKHSLNAKKETEKMISDALAGNISLIEGSIINQDGSFVPIIFSISPLRDINGKIIGLIQEGKLITVQKNLQDKKKPWETQKEYSSRLKKEINTATLRLKEMEQFNKELVNSALIDFIYLDEDDKLLFVNPAMECKMAKFGLSKNFIKGKSLSEIGFYPADSDWKKIIEPVGSKIVSGRRRMIFSKNAKELLQFEVKAGHLMGIMGRCKRKRGTILIMDDVTEQNLLEENVLRSRILSEKMNSIELLIAGVAHELNNPLTSIIGCAEYLEEDPEISKESREAVKIIINDAKRAGKIVKNMDDFSDKDKIASVPVNLNKVIRTIVEIRITLMKKRGINVILQLDPGLHAVKANVTEMQQVILNLLRNAVHAIEESGIGDTIYIRTFIRDTSVVVEVEDTGPGIPEENLTKIFDPFFTTRQQKKGSGLGLSIVYGIVQKHGGIIFVDRACKTGARFVIHFPLSAPLLKIESLEFDSVSWTLFQVLVVDDEKNICMTLSKHLRRLGCEVDTVLSSRAALAKIGQRDYDLLLVDVKMPQMNGLELYQKICDLHPELQNRFAFITGISEHEKNELVDILGVPVLRKPFTRKDIIFFLHRYKSFQKVDIK